MRSACHGFLCADDMDLFSSSRVFNLALLLAVEKSPSNCRQKRPSAVWLEKQTAWLHHILVQNPRLVVGKGGAYIVSASILTAGRAGKRGGNAEEVSEIRALCKEGRLDKALAVLKRMDEEGYVPEVHVYKNLLQLCMKQKAFVETKRVQAHLRRNALEANTTLGNLLVTTLVNCGRFADGLQVFERLSERTVFSWTAIISGLSNSGKCREALARYKQMQQEGVEPNPYTFVSLIKACSKLEDLEQGMQIHAATTRQGLDTDVFVGNTLVSMYAKCGSIADAQQVFDTLSQRDVVSWNALLAAYAQQGQGETALELFRQMQEEGIRPEARTFVSALQACGSLAEKEGAVLLNNRETVKVASLRKGKEIHCTAIVCGYESDVFVGNTLVAMYTKCGSIQSAEKVFDMISHHDVVSWNALLAAYAQQGQGGKALHIFRRMQHDGVRPDAWTFVSTLRACGSLAEEEESTLVDGQSMKLQSLTKGRELHAEVSARGFQSDLFVGTALLSMYGKCGSIVDAQQVFDGLSERNVVSWNALLAAYGQQEQGQGAERALQIYQHMQETGMKPSVRTFVAALQACGSLAEREQSALVADEQDLKLSLKVESLLAGKKVHAEVMSRAFESEVFVGNALVSMYAKCGSIRDAKQVFDRLPYRDVVSWNAMLAAHVEHGQGGEALQLYARMDAEGLTSDDATLVSVLEACSETGALDVCRNVHQSILQRGFPCSHSLATSLIHAYSKCGSMVDAQSVFDSLQHPDVVSWTALIAGYARLGDCGQSIECYQDMLQQGVKPDSVTFLALLSACAHSGMVDKGLEYFESMRRDYGLFPELQHYACLIDIVSRAGLFSKAQDLLSSMPMQPDLPVWLCLLGACQKHGNVVLGKRAFDAAVALEPTQAAPYVLMSNIYADAGLMDSAKEVDDLRHTAGAWKKPGQSWIEHQDQVHTFLVGQRKHEQQAVLYGLLQDLRRRQAIM